MMYKNNSSFKIDFLVSLYIFFIVTAEMMGSKTFFLFNIGDYTLNGAVGMLLIPFIYSINDIVFEVYGKERIRNLAKISLIVILLLTIFVSIAVILPPSTRFLSTEPSYDLIFSQSIRISIASLIALGISNLLDIAIFSKLKTRLKKTGLWFRNNMSNILALFIDTVIFMTLAFYALEDPISANVSFLWGIILPYWILKSLVSSFGTPFVYLGIKWLRNKRVRTYEEALGYIYDAIPKTKRTKFPGDRGRERQKYLLKLLGDPQDKIKVIHIAGTSGKGSTASYLSKLLSEQGFKVGLTVSPHLKDIRERVQVNSELISKKDFVRNLNDIIPFVEEVKEGPLGAPTYFEIMVSLMFYTFYKSNVDYAVIECGLGGLYDGTNAVHSSNKVAVITNIGLDHTEILGGTTVEIARQKAGIILKGNKVFSVKQRKRSMDVLNEEARKKRSSIQYLTKGRDYKNIKLVEEGLQYDLLLPKLKIENLLLKSFANYHVSNSALSLMVLSYLSKRDKWKIEIPLVREVLSTFQFEGRMSLKEMKYKGRKRTLILDGAHNPVKMRAFLNSLSNLKLKGKTSFVLAVKLGKDYKQMLRSIIPFADSIYITKFHIEGVDMVLRSTEMEEMKSTLSKLKYKNFKMIEDPVEAINMAMKDSDNIVVTGSLYLLSEVYERMGL